MGENFITDISMVLFGTFILLTAAAYLINKYNLIQRVYNNRFARIVWIIINVAGIISGSVVLFKQLWFLGLLILSVTATSVWLYKSGGNLPWLTSIIKVGIIFIIVILIFIYYSQLGIFKKVKILFF